MSSMSIPEDMLEFFTDLMKSHGAGEFMQGGQYSLSRQPFADGYVFFQNPVNSFITISCNCSCGIKGISNIWEAEMNALTEEFKDSQDSKDD